MTCTITELHRPARRPPRTRRPECWVWACLALGASNTVTAQIAAPEPLARCEALAELTVPAGALSLPTGRVTLTTAVRVSSAPRSTSADGELVLELPAHCRVQGEIAPVDPQAPPIRFNINLPERWNAKAMQSGGGGLGGIVNTAPGQKASGRFDPQPLNDPYPLARGYATFGSDDGHRDGDVSFIYHREALENWAGAALMKTRDLAVWLIEQAYGRAPERMYFNGESAGGREAMYVAQRYPEAYDGVIAVTPVLSWTYIHLGDNHIRSTLIDGWLDAPAIKLIAAATRAACDADDGLADGILARYLECRVDPNDLRCPAGAPGTGCLTDAQIASLLAIREPWSTAVPHAYGVTRYPGFGITGDEDNPSNQYSFYTIGTVPPTHPLPPGPGWQRGLGGILNFGAIWVRHAIVGDETFEPYGFYPPTYAARIQELSAMFDATDPDLSRLRIRGGKAIILHQSADNAVGTPMIAEYYRSVRQTLGPLAADDVLRLYIGPGGTHNGGGVAQADLISLLEAWVERGVAPPTEIPVHDLDPATHALKRSMVACAYPLYTRYTGSGDINASDSYRCTPRSDPLDFPVSTR
jgi:hypothetical protein